MNDDALISANEREIFEAIVSQLGDPEEARLRRIFIALSTCLFLLGAIAVTAVAGLGWAGLCSFSLTFVSGLLLTRRILARRLALPPLP